MADRGLAEQFAIYAARIHAQAGSERTIHLVTEYARDALNCDDAGVLLRAEGRLTTASATSSRVEESDRVQRETGEGPCFAASTSSELFSVRDTHTEDRWPDWAHIVADLGIRSAIGVPLRTHDRNYGALNLYSEHPQAFDDDDIAVALIFARHAAIALDGASKEESFNHALDARKAIGQAQGIIMERYGVDADAAFEVLLRYSQDNNVKLRAVAEHVVAERAFPDSDEG
jgi:GAF domain-containing protein